MRPVRNLEPIPSRHAPFVTAGPVGTGRRGSLRLVTICGSRVRLPRRHRARALQHSMAMQRLRLAGMFALLAGGGLASGLQAAEAGAECPAFAGPLVGSRVESAEIDEASGLVASRRHPGIFWTHNDSGDGPRIFALDQTGASRGVFELSDADAIDWEAIALGPGPEPGRDYLYLGDIGDNSLRRGSVVVHRIAEPKPLAPVAAGGKARENPPSGSAADPRGPAAGASGAAHFVGAVDTFVLEHPRGPQDSEAMLVDPRSGDLLLLTKEDWDCEPVPGPGCGRGWILRVPGLAAMAAGARVALHAEGRFEVAPDAPRFGRLATAADISADGRWILVRTYQRGGLWERRDGELLAETLRRPPCPVPMPGWPEERQGEAVALAPDGQAYWTLSEGDHPTFFAHVHTPRSRPEWPAPPADAKERRPRDRTSH